jgi:hypothetical protein
MKASSGLDFVLSDTSNQSILRIDRWLKKL